MIVYIDDAIRAANESKPTPDAYYAKTRLVATSKYHAIDGWRGYQKLTAEPGYKIVKSSWLTGDWSDAPRNHSESEVKHFIDNLEKEHGKVYVVFTPTSNVFNTSYDVLVETDEPKPKHKKVALHTYRMEYADGWGIRYHATEVIRYNSKNNTYTIDTGGWFTKTTKERINKYLPNPYYVYQKNFLFYLHTPTGDVEFKEPLTIGVTNE